jgi:hypothetical protein
MVKKQRTEGLFKQQQEVAVHEIAHLDATSRPHSVLSLPDKLLFSILKKQVKCEFESLSTFACCCTEAASRCKKGIEEVLLSMKNEFEEKGGTNVFDER